VTCALLLAASRTAFAVIASPFELSPATTLPTRANEVGLVIDVPAQAAPPIVRLLARHHATASFATSRPGTSFERLLATHHDQPISQLGRPGIDDWLGTMDAVRDVRDKGFVLVPHGGISTGQYVLARLSGAHLIAPARQIKRGAIILWKGGSLEHLLDAIAQHGLRPAPVAALTRRVRA
jgi:hypothetical protein